MNEKHDIVIIGCGAGGGTAAQFARKTDRNAQITLYEKGPYPQYSKCGLPYAISGEIPAITDLIEFSEEWFSKAKIDLKLNTKVNTIHPEKKEITIDTENENKSTKAYTSLIIATGATPAISPIKHIVQDSALVNGAYTLRTIDDAKKISNKLSSNGKQATVIGAGLIGLEMADSLHKKGLDVTIIEALPTILPNTLDEDLSAQISNKLSEKITIYTSHFASEIQTKQDSVSEVIIKQKESMETTSIPTDILIIATGTRPETMLAQQAGCKIGITEGIQVNNKSQTSQEQIYAVGDCTEFKDFITKQPILVGLGSIAVRQGIAAGINATGGEYELPDGALQTCTSEFFGNEIAAVGPSQHFLNQKDIIIGKHTGLSKPSYYPGGTPVTVKTKIAASNGTILAAQAVGENAAQRINTYATAILAKLNHTTFRTLETAYAPSIAPTLDVVTIAVDIAAMKYQRIHNR